MGRGHWTCAALLALMACGQGLGPPGGAPAAPGPTTTAVNVATAQAVEVLRGEGKVYVRVKESQWDFWVMAPDQPLVAGDYLLLGRGPQRRLHRSGSLDRDFRDIIELETISVVDQATAEDMIQLRPAPGGLSVAAVFAGRLGLVGKPVKVRGRVVKANHGIFGTNWYHLQDGSGSAEAKDHDLTVTSEVRVEVGQVVVAEGPLTIDKDLGFGYFFPAIVEGAALQAE